MFYSTGPGSFSLSSFVFSHLTTELQWLHSEAQTIKNYILICKNVDTTTILIMILLITTLLTMTMLITLNIGDIIYNGITSNLFYF